MSDQTTHKFIRIREVSERTGLSRAQLYALMKEGKFPNVVKLGARASACIESEVDAWMNRKIADSRGVTSKEVSA